MIGTLATITLTAYATAYAIKKTGITFDQMVEPVKKSVTWLTEEAQSLKGKCKGGKTTPSNPQQSEFHFRPDDTKQ